MRRFYLLFSSILGVSAMQAQFINNGATVVIQSGATLKVETSFQNNLGGTVTNNGTLEVTGDFENNATFNSGASSLVKFSGNTAANAKSGGATLNHVEMAKTSANVTLTDAMSINGDLSFTGTASKVVLGTNNLTLAATSNVTGAGAAGYVVTNGTGAMVKGMTGDGTKVLEVGDMTNYSPVSNAVTGTSYTTANISARAYTTGLQAKYAEATDFIAREWNVVASGIGGYANTMTGTYVAGDVTGTASLIKGASHHTGDWRFDGSAGAANTVTASTTNSDVKLSGMNFFGKANLKVFLAGALSGGMMTTTLNSILPLTTPYTVAPFSAPSVTAPSIPANATDWILVEVRDASTPSTTISQTSAFVLNNGTIVNYDGSPLRLKDAVANAHIAIRHRNHLAIRTASVQNLISPTLVDFTSSLATAYTHPTHPVAPYANANMRLIGSVYAMWGGNVNANNTVRYSGPANDISALLTALGGVSSAVLGSPPPLVYSFADINMNGVVRYSGPANDNSALLQNLDGNSNNVYTSHQ